MERFSENQAMKTMLRECSKEELSGRDHFVLTGVTLIHQAKEQTLEGLDRTRVWFTRP
jgi:predicted house-cleaning NTP pyrophosphatase (Maf/HAM1 superfamily)